MGYRITLSRWMGPSPARKTVTVYSIGTATGVIDGKTVHHTSEFDPGIEVGQTYVVPIADASPFGVPLKDGEYWAVGSGISIYKLDGNDAVRAVSLEGSGRSSVDLKDTSTLEELAGIARAAGLAEQTVQ